MVEVTEVRLSRRNSKDGKLKAFATITFDNQFVIRDLKIIDGKKGYFVAMPSKKVYDSCQKCGKKNPIRNNYCGKCGVKLNPRKVDRREEHRDIAHPINSQTRDYIQEAVVGEYKKALEEGGFQDDEESDYFEGAKSSKDDDFDKISAYEDDYEIEAEHTEHIEHTEEAEHSEDTEHELADRLDI